MKGFLPRLHVLRSLAPRVSAPLLPITNIRLARSALTNTPRVPQIRLFTRSSARLTSRSPSPTTHPQNALPPDASMSQRLKHLIKTYGWYALGVYLVIGALDFGVAFVGINLLGAQYVSQVVASVKTMVGSVLHSKPAEPGKDEMESINNPHANGGQEGLYAMLVLAYTIHKTLFLPVRVGVTAAVTPRLVGWLTRRGWSGASGARRAGQEVRERIRERQNRGSR
ncbi:hypothetical protein GALMADRAFT_98890 [Galerina marginata CBS 339.88]|uniref:DUF1279 domain-containing protein n=1 Tax=Galerina marginata (strain CBS 339.88) TaxID=685588 RepID=A0A067T681_GALM3|nr:hypothetical protein GALMADRAFT_98890 [Galerina marginata CBS 339.88]